MSVDKSEKKIAKKLGGRLTNASGAVNNDADIRCGKLLIECKRRDTLKKINFAIATFEKLRKQAIRANKTPIYILQLPDGKYVMSFVETLTELIDAKKRSYMVKSGDIARTNIIVGMQEFWDHYYTSHTGGSIPIYAVASDNYEFALGIMEFEDFKSIIEEDK